MKALALCPLYLSEEGLAVFSEFGRGALFSQGL